jgi:hypothetical protein
MQIAGSGFQNWQIALKLKNGCYSKQNLKLIIDSPTECKSEASRYEAKQF